MCIIYPPYLSISPPQCCLSTILTPSCLQFALTSSASVMSPILLTLILSLIPLVFCTPAPLSPPIISTTLSTLPLNLTIDPEDARCTRTTSFFNLASRAPAADCIHAASELLADAADYGHLPFHWLSWDTPAPRGITHGKPTPKRYVFGKCTLTIALLRDVPHWTLRPAELQSRATIAWASYYELYMGSKELLDTCIARQGRMGWYAPSESFLEFH